MAKTYDTLTPELIEFIEAQKIFFVASAPLAGDGHVNLSPKGYDSLRVLDAKRVAYLDLTGSGAETIAHLKENGRITLMWCSFNGAPRIMRVHGRGTAAVKGSAEYSELRPSFGAAHLGERAIIVVDALRISTSCGYAVPLMSFAGERETLDGWAAKKDLPKYRRDNNTTSLDGLPSITEET